MRTLFTHAVFFCFKCRHKSVHEVRKTYYDNILEKVFVRCLKCGFSAERGATKDER